jgi:hypothetical protein
MELLYGDMQYQTISHPQNPDERETLMTKMDMVDTNPVPAPAPSSVVLECCKFKHHAALKSPTVRACLSSWREAS